MIRLAVVISALCAAPAWGKWYLDLAAGGGLADQRFEAHGDLSARWEFEAVTVWRVAVGGGIKYASEFEVGSELAWSQRGGSFTSLGGSIQHLVPRVIENERSYLDVSVAVRQGWHLGPVAVFVAAAPRLSVLFDEELQLYRRGEPESVVFGIDPELRVTYSRAHAWCRYYWDLTPSYKSSTAEVRDRSVFFGLGWRIE